MHRFPLESQWMKRQLGGLVGGEEGAGFLQVQKSKPCEVRRCRSKKGTQTFSSDAPYYT